MGNLAVWLVLILALVPGCTRENGVAHDEPDARATVVPANPDALRILPLGDSITAGPAGSASYRYWLQKKLEEADIAFDFVGSQSGVAWGSPAHDDFDPDHEGHWGWTSSEVLDRIDGWAKAARPDVVLLHLGTNDLGSRPDVVAPNLGRIIAELRDVNHRVAVFVAQLIPIYRFPQDVHDRVAADIARMANELSTDASPVIVVDQRAGFDPARDTYDGVHPNESGEKKMAERWFEAIRSWLSEQRPSLRLAARASW